jgi:hypothetical protein
MSKIPLIWAHFAPNLDIAVCAPIWKKLTKVTQVKLIIYSGAVTMPSKECNFTPVGFANDQSLAQRALNYRDQIDILSQCSALSG